MIPSFQSASIKCALVFVILCSLNLYFASCENPKNGKSLMKNQANKLGLQNELSSSENEKPEDASEASSDLNEYEVGEYQNLDYISKLRLLELFLNEIRKKEDNVNNFKRNLQRSAGKDSDRKRPGWELAFGRRKRFINNKN